LDYANGGVSRFGLFRRRRHHATDGSFEFDGDGGIFEPDQSSVDGIDGQRWGNWVQHPTMRGQRLHEFRSSHGSTTAYSDVGLAASTSYSYQVQATDAAGNLSAFSNTATATTGASTGTPGLVAAYDFNAGTGTTVADVSGNGNTGTIVNATWTTSGKYGDALSLNGTNAQVVVNDSASLHLTTAVTLEAWVNPSSAPTGWQDVIYKPLDNYFLEAASSNGNKPGAGALLTSSAEPLAYGTAQLAANTWTHLAMTYDGTTLKIYVNGTLATSAAQSGTITTSANPLQIGGDTTYGQYFKGLIDEVRIYNVALTQAQIQSDMSTPLP
jgi:hypothetical protein